MSQQISVGDLGMTEEIPTGVYLHMRTSALVEELLENILVFSQIVWEQHRRFLRHTNENFRCSRE